MGGMFDSSTEVGQKPNSIINYTLITRNLNSTAASFGHLLTTSFGLGLPISRELEHIQRLPYALQQQITIQKFCAKVEKAMFDTPSILDLQPLSDIDHLVVPLEAELLGLEESLGMLSRKLAIYNTQ